MSQPLHPSIVPRLDEEYRDFHNSHLINIVPPHTLPWSPEIRNAPAVPGGSTPLPVHITRDIALTHTKCRVFVPHGDPPENGWPTFIFFHGGMSPPYLSLCNSWAISLQEGGPWATLLAKLRSLQTWQSVRPQISDHIFSFYL